MGVIAGNSKSEQLLDFVRETFRTLKVARSDLGLYVFTPKIQLFFSMTLRRVKQSKWLDNFFIGCVSTIDTIHDEQIIAKNSNIPKISVG